MIFDPVHGLITKEEKDFREKVKDKISFHRDLAVKMESLWNLE